MSYYGQQWTAGADQSNWEQQPPPSRSGASSANPREDTIAFASQFDEIDRAYDNLYKSGRGGMFQAPPLGPPARRDPMHMGGQGRDFQGYDPRAGGPAQRQQSADFSNDARSYSGSNVQGFYAAQRQQQPSRGGSGNEAEQVMQAKKRMAAQRERELRNYHQEQQYNRTPAGAQATGNDRTMSPASGMSEDERRELIARQRNALYGDGNPSSTMYSDTAAQMDDNKRSVSGSQTATASQASMQVNDAVSAQSKAEPSNNGDNLQRTSGSSSGDSPPGDSILRKGSVAPIGTRPPVGAPLQAQNPVLAKQRSVTPGSLAYGYSSIDDGQVHKNGSTNGSNIPAPSDGGLSGWNNKNGAIWGSKSSSNAQASVWG